MYMRYSPVRSGLGKTVQVNVVFSFLSSLKSHKRHLLKQTNKQKKIYNNLANAETPGAGVGLNIVSMSVFLQNALLKLVHLSFLYSSSRTENHCLNICVYIYIYIINLIHF